MKLYFEIAVNQKTKTHDQTFEGVPDFDFSYLTCFMNYEVNNFKKCEFDKVNLII